MPWKIVNLDYGSRPHLHLKDPHAPIHLRSFFADQRVEIGLGADDPEDCFVRASVTPDDVVVQATKFEPVHVQILASILTSLDVDPGDREAALAWMRDALARHGGDDRSGATLAGNVASFPRATGWPADLTDEALLESLDDREGAPRTRVHALMREAERRGLRAPAPRPDAKARARAPEPEVIRRRRP